MILNFNFFFFKKLSEILLFIKTFVGLKKFRLSLCLNILSLLFSKLIFYFDLLKKNQNKLNFFFFKFFLNEMKHLKFYFFFFKKIFFSSLLLKKNIFSLNNKFGKNIFNLRVKSFFGYFFRVKKKLKKKINLLEKKNLKKKFKKNLGIFLSNKIRFLKMLNKFSFKFFFLKNLYDHSNYNLNDHKDFYLFVNSFYFLKFLSKMGLRRIKIRQKRKLKIFKRLKFFKKRKELKKIYLEVKALEKRKSKKRKAFFTFAKHLFIKFNSKKKKNKKFLKWVKKVTNFRSGVIFYQLYRFVIISRLGYLSKYFENEKIPFVLDFFFKKVKLKFSKKIWNYSGTIFFWYIFLGFLYFLKKKKIKKNKFIFFSFLKNINFKKIKFLKRKSFIKSIYKFLCKIFLIILKLIKKK